MQVLRSILYIFSLLTVAGAIEGLTGNRIGMHEWLATLPIHPSNSWLALTLGVVVFTLAEYLAYIAGDPPVVLYVAAFIARVILFISIVVAIVALCGIVVSILATTGHLANLKDEYPIIFFNLDHTWVAAVIWFIICIAAAYVYIKLNPAFRPGKRHPDAGGYIHVEEIEEAMAGEGEPEDQGEHMGPAMRRLTTRGIRPIYVERNPIEPLGRLSGEVGILNIFVDSPKATWPEDQIMLATQSVHESIQWLENEAIGKTELKFKNIGHLRTPTPGWAATDRMKLTPKELRQQVLEILGGIGIDGLEDLHYYLLRYSDEPGNIALFHYYLRAGSWCLPAMHPNVGMATCFHRHDPELTRPHFIDDDDLEIFPGMSCIYAHLILHLFGATDKPVRSVSPNIDVMSAVSTDVDDLFIGFKTGKEIGW